MLRTQLSVSANSCLRLVFLALLVVSGFIAGARLWIKYGAESQFYQTEYAPAMAIACGYGFKLETPLPAPAADFLGGRRPTLTCAEAFPKRAPADKPNTLQYQTVSLQYLFAGLWKLFGFTWSVAAIVTGGLLALTGFATYRLAHQLLGVWPSLALGFTVVLAMPAVSRNVVDIRDFSKAPFVLLMMSLCLSILFAPARRLPLLCTGAGLITAIGIGFRTDVSLFVALVPLALLLRLADASSWRNSSWRNVAVGLVLFASVLVAYNHLVLPFWTGVGRNNPHFAVLGQTTMHIQSLGMNEARQGAIYLYNDIATHEITSLFAKSARQAEPGYNTPAYDAAGRALLGEISRTLPADLIAMALSATYRSLMQTIGGGALPQALLLIGTSLVLALRFGWRGLAYVSIALLLGGITGVQFAPRHTFHLAIVGNIMLVATAAVLLPDALKWFQTRLARQIPADLAERARAALAPFSDGRDGRMPGRIFLTMLLIMPVVLVAARAYETRAIKLTVDKIAQFQRRPLAELSSPRPGSQLFDGSTIERTSYASITLKRPSDCAEFPAIAVLYESNDGYHRWDTVLKTPPGDVTAAFFPIPINDNRVVSIRSIGHPGCQVDAAKLDPDQRFLPFVFFAGQLSGPSYLTTGLERTLAETFDRATMRIRKRECILQNASSRGGAPARHFEQVVTVPSFIEIASAATSDGYFSNHLDIGGAMLQIGDQILDLSLLSYRLIDPATFTIARGENLLAKPLRVDGRTFDSGLGIYAPARIVLAVPRKLVQKTAVLKFAYGIDDLTEGRGATTLDVCLIQ